MEIQTPWVGTKNGWRWYMATVSAVRQANTKPSIMRMNPSRLRAGSRNAPLDLRMSNPARKNTAQMLASASAMES